MLGIVETFTTLLMLQQCPSAALGPVAAVNTPYTAERSPCLNKSTQCILGNYRPNFERNVPKELKEISETLLMY